MCVCACVRLCVCVGSRKSTGRGPTLTGRLWFELIKAQHGSIEVFIDVSRLTQVALLADDIMALQKTLSFYPVPHGAMECSACCC